MRRTLATTASAFVDTASKLERLLKTAEVCEITGLSKTTIWCEVRAGRFPESVSLSPNRRGLPCFRNRDVDERTLGEEAFTLTKR